MVTVESCFIVLILIFQNTTLFCNQESQYVSVDCFATKMNKIENLDGQMKEYTHKGRVGLQQRRGSIGGEVPAKFKREFALVIHRTKEKSCNRYEQLVTSVSIVFFVFSIFSSLYIIFCFSFINIRPIGEFSCFIKKIRAGGACATKTSLKYSNRAARSHMVAHPANCCCLTRRASRGGAKGKGTRAMNFRFVHMEPYRSRVTRPGQVWSRVSCRVANADLCWNLDGQSRRN
jgi:hypothetical protein